MKRTLAITAVAVAVFAGFFLVPARPRLTHMDFVAGGPDALEFCDAANPRFLPVVARDSPVTLSLSGTGPYFVGQEADLVLVLRTNTGKSIEPKDLLATGGRALSLFAIDPSLTDFQVPELHREDSGGWRVRFTPRAGGAYRVFADFTPAATGQEMYASADLAVEGRPAAASAAGAGLAVESEGLRCRLSPSQPQLRIREPAILTLGVARADGTPVAPDRAGGRSPELVAFDRARSGLVVLRLGTGGSARVSFPDSGTYAIWARLRADGQDRSVPFSVQVHP